MGTPKFSELIERSPEVLDKAPEVLDGLKKLPPELREWVVIAIAAKNETGAFAKAIREHDVKKIAGILARPPVRGTKHIVMNPVESAQAMVALVMVAETIVAACASGETSGISLIALLQSVPGTLFHLKDLYKVAKGAIKEILGVQSEEELNKLSVADVIERYKQPHVKALLNRAREAFVDQDRSEKKSDEHPKPMISAKA